MKNSEELEIIIVDDKTGDEIVGNYDYFISIDGTQIYKGRIENHNRLTGWDGVVRLLGKQFSRNDEFE